MNISSLLTRIIEPAFIQAGIGEFPIILQPAKNYEFGDYQINGVMGAAKKIKQPPRVLAQKVVNYIDQQDIIDSLEIAGPGFINIRLNNFFLNQKINQAIQNERLDITTRLEKEKVVIDYSSPNLAKEMHVGHLRSTIIGDSLHRIYKFMGAQIIPQNHVGDWGTQFGMLVAYLIEQEKNKQADLELSDLESFYRSAKKRFDEDENFAHFSRECVVKLQHNEPIIREYWKKFVSISIQHIQMIYNKLGVLLTEKDILGESEYNDELPNIVNSLIEKGIAINDNGTKLVYLEDLKDENGKPGAFIIQKQDGGYLYSTTDFACLKYNIRENHATRLLYVVDARQSLHFKSIFQISERAGWLPDDVHAEHIAFGTMMGPDGKPFKTRAGGTIKLGELLDEAVLRARKLVQEKNPTLSLTDIEKIAEVIGIGAVKYADLSKNRLSDYIFDWNTMLSFEGNTAPYLQYAYARVNSLLLKANECFTNFIQDYQYIETIEKQLALLLLQFEEVLVQVIETNHPHYLANYIYQLATLFSRFYEFCDILKSTHTIKCARLGLSYLVGKTLKQGLYLLGIDVLERM